MAQPKPSEVAMTPRIARLIELETSGRIKPEHLQELNAYRAQGIAPPRPKGAPVADLNRQFDNDEVLRQIEMAKQLVRNRTLGGANVLLSGIPGTESRDLAGALSTIGSNITTGRLSQLKESSPTGASGFGSLTEKEGQLLRDAIAALDQGQSDAKLLDSLNAVERRYRRLSAALQGINPDEVDTSQQGTATPTIGGNDQAPVPPAIPGAGNAPPGSPPGTPPTEPPSTPYSQIGLATGNMGDDVSEATRAVEARVSNMVEQGRSADDVREFLRSAGIDPAGVEGIDEAVRWRQDNPTYRGSFTVKLGKPVPLDRTTMINTEQANSPFGAFLIGAGNAVTGGRLDELTDNPQVAQAGKELIRAENPTSDLIGNVAGGAAMGALGEAGLARLGVPAGSGGVIAPRALASDTAYGAYYGSGESNQDRTLGGLYGAGAGAGGGLLGRFLMNSAGRAISPTGGELRPLYDAGVRPTLGQRFVNSGPLGNAVNTVEEAMQSIPLAGAAVRGARGRAREQFERGAFNEALKEIDKSLPEGMQLGVEPHSYMQKSFDEVYDKARSGMTFVPDQDYQLARNQFRQALGSGVYSEDQVKRITNILDNAVTSRLQAGQGSLTGDAYKQAASDIAKASRKLSRTEPLIADALNDYIGIFDEAARRNSAPEAVALLDKADRGYAKAVRIEKAAEMRGANQDIGRFTPAQFDRAVQNSTSGVRSRAYLRGDALMGDYAQAGKALSDRLPNSGTVDRALMTGALMGGGHAVGPAAALPVAATAAYLPGVRSLTTQFLSPRQTKELVTLGELFKRKSYAGGALTAPFLIEESATAGQ